MGGDGRRSPAAARRTVATTSITAARPRMPRRYGGAAE
jgi:hypothetical protein